MASPNDTKSTDHMSDLSGADQAFLDAMGQGGKGWRGDANDTLLDKAVQVKTIRSRFMTSVLPIMIVPLLLMAFIAILGLTLLGSRTTGAVGTTDELLEEQNLAIASTMETSADIGVRDINRHLIAWFAAVSELEDADVPASEVAAAFEEANAVDVGSSQNDVQVLFVESNGAVLSSSHPDSTADSYVGAEWVEAASTTDVYRPFVNDEEHVPSHEFSLSLDDGNLVRVRVPFTNVQDALDNATGSTGNVDLVLADGTSGVLLAATATGHDPAGLFTPASLQNLATGFVDDVMAADGIESGFVSNEERATFTATVLEDVSPLQFPFLDVQWSVQSTEELDSLSAALIGFRGVCLLYTSPSPRDQRGSRMPSSA